MHLLVTGATGCVGRAVVAEALSRGWRVRGVARRAPSPPLPGPVEFIAASVEDGEAMNRATRGCDAVVHLAGYVHRIPRTPGDIAALRASIVDGTVAVGRAARSSGAALVHTSTVAVYGPSPSPAAAETERCQPNTPYAIAKLDAEERLAAICPGAVQLRLSLVFGPHDRGNFAALVRAVDRRLAVCVGRGDNRKSLAYAEHVAQRIVRVCERECARPGAVGPGPWNVVDASPTQRELLDLIAASLGRRPPPRVPRAPAEGLGWLVDAAARAAGRPGQWRARVCKLASQTWFSGSAVDARIDYRPPLSLDESIRRAAQWYRSHGRA